MNTTLIQDVLGSLLTELQLPFDGIEIADEEDFTRVEIISSNASRIIGWHGETLNSIQQLLKAIIRAKENLEKAPFIVLDVDGYLRSKEDKIRTMVEQKAELVRRTGSRVALAPMSPYFRRIAHLHISNTPALADLITQSTGEGDYRQVVLRMKDESAPAGEELSPIIENDDTNKEGFDNLDI